LLSEEYTITPGVLVPDAASNGTRTIAPWLTGEVALYIGLGLVALVLRAAGLGTRPLDSPEAAQALAAWQPWAGPATHSPLLFFGNLITFSLFAASEAWARILPALFGTALALAPGLYRRWLGRTGALIAVLLLTLSPTALYYSRYLSGDIVVAAAGLYALAGILHLIRTHEACYAALAVVALALMVTAGPGAYAVIFIGLTFVALVALGSGSGYTRVGWERLVSGWHALSEEPGRPGRLALFFVVPVILIGTAALLYFAAFQSIIDLFSVWIGQIGAVPGGASWYYHFQLLLFYEPLILVFGLAGIVLAFLRRNFLSTFLTYWAVVAVYAYSLFGGKTSGDLLIALTPLAVLAGWAAGYLIDLVSEYGAWDVEGVYLAIAGPIVVYLYLQLAAFAQGGQLPYLWLLAAGIVLTTLLFVGYVFWVGLGAAIRSLGLAALIVLFLVVCHVGWDLNYSGLGSANEIMAQAPTHPAIQTLRSSLEQLSVWRVGDKHEIPVDVVALNDPALHWMLRDFRTVRYTDVVRADAADPIFITADSQPGESMPEGYRGQRFAIRSQSPLQGLRGVDLLNWWLYRKAASPATMQYVVLWANNDGGPAVVPTD
jgi:uncharacterized protein (TIGR03663 family)